MDDLIRRRATGTPEEFAQKMGLSRSALMEYIKSLKALNAPIRYDNLRRSYCYLFPCKLKVGFEGKLPVEEELTQINKKELKKFCEVISLRK